MIDPQIVNHTRKTAEQSLAMMQQSDPDTWSGLQLSSEPVDDRSVLWWHGELPLVEIALTDQGGAPSGYLLVSADERLPPILECATSGAPRTRTVANLLARSLKSPGAAKFQRHVFYTSTEIYAELLHDGELFRVRLPSLSSFKVTEAGRAAVSPASIFDQSIVSSQWSLLSTRQPPPGPALVILKDAAPVKYNQNCDKYSRSDWQLQLGQPEVNPCAPHATAGCVPVAWAMLLSSWKRMGHKGSEKIWARSTDWNTDWDETMTPNPSKSADVEKTIWRLHKLLSTTPDGGTESDKDILGAQIFKEFGIDVKYNQNHNADFDFAMKIIGTKQPFLFGAQGHWPVVNKKAGHAVIVYGYNRTQRWVLLCPGWGVNSSDPADPLRKDLWVNFDQYKDTYCIYL
jgi:hypothetical protein